MTYYRKRKPAPLPGPVVPVVESLPRGTLSWEDDDLAEHWMLWAPVYEPDRVASRKLPDGRTVTGHLWMVHVHGEGGKAVQVTRIVWDTGAKVVGRIYGALRDGLAAWAKFKATGEEVK